MQDTLIIKNYYAYQFRVDILHSHALSKFTEWRDKFNCSYYLAGLETSEKHKQHIQSIVWFKDPIDAVKLRNWWKNKTLDTKQPVSITTAKKVKSLVSYCRKDKNYYTNLSKEQLSQVPKWKPKIKDDTFKEKLHKLFKDTDKNCLDKYEISEKVLELYTKHERMPKRSYLLYLLWKYSYISNRSYLVNYLNI